MEPRERNGNRVKGWSLEKGMGTSDMGWSLEKGMGTRDMGGA